LLKIELSKISFLSNRLFCIRFFRKYEILEAHFSNCHQSKDSHGPAKDIDFTSQTSLGIPASSLEAAIDVAVQKVKNILSLRSL
jgi:hypothetical protein